MSGPVSGSAAGGGGAPLRVALVHPHFRPDGGAERMFARILASLAGAEGLRLTVITRRLAGIEQEGAGGFELVRCDPWYVGRLLREWTFARAVRRLLARRRFDLVQSQVRLPCDVYRAGGGVHREWLRQRARVRPGWRRLLDRLSPYHRYKLREEARLYRHPRLRAVICNSHMVRRQIEAHFGVPAERLHVIYNGVDPERFRPRGPADEPARAALRGRLGIGEADTAFVFVGSGFERKGLAAAIAALARLPGDCHLVVVGGDKEVGRYRRQAARLRVEHRLHLVGVQREVLPYYHAADGFVLPTLYDPFANAVLEALACALPVVTSLQCGAVDLIRDGENGFVCDALDIEGLASRMAQLRKPARRRAVGLGGRAAAAGLTLERMREALLGLYRALLAERAAAAPRGGTAALRPAAGAGAG